MLFRRRPKNIYLVYTLGKVGSTSIYESLKSRLKNDLVFHVHFLSSHYLDDVLPQTAHTWNIKHGQSILKQISDNPKARIKIISSFREPLSREVSNLFQNSFDYSDKPLSELEEIELLSLADKLDFNYTLSWFNLEFKNYTGEDILQFDSPAKRGYTLATTEKFDLLLLRMEDLSSAGLEGLRKFTKKRIHLTNANQIKDKASADTYKFFKKNLRYPREKLQSVYEDQVVQFFYTKDELKKFFSDWNSNLV